MVEMGLSENLLNGWWTCTEFGMPGLRVHDFGVAIRLDCGYEHNMGRAAKIVADYSEINTVL